MSSLDGAFLELTRLGLHPQRGRTHRKQLFNGSGRLGEPPASRNKAEQFSLPGGNAEGKVEFSGHVSLAFD